MIVNKGRGLDLSDQISKFSTSFRVKEVNLDSGDWLGLPGILGKYHTLSSNLVFGCAAYLQFVKTPRSKRPILDLYKTFKQEVITPAIHLSGLFTCLSYVFLWQLKSKYAATVNAFSSVPVDKPHSLKQKKKKNTPIH